GSVCRRRQTGFRWRGSVIWRLNGHTRHLDWVVPPGRVTAVVHADQILWPQIDSCDPPFSRIACKLQRASVPGNGWDLLAEHNSTLFLDEHICGSGVIVNLRQVCLEELHMGDFGIHFLKG